MAKSVKRRADVVLQDFMILTNHENFLCRAIREALHRTQSWMSNKVNLHQTIISSFETGERINKDTKKLIFDFIHKINYECYERLDTDDFILYCIRVMGNYMSICHEFGVTEDDERTKKLMAKEVSMLGFAE